MKASLLHHKRDRLRHRLSVVLIDRTWYVKVDGVVHSYGSLADAMTAIGDAIEHFADCTCPHH